MNYRQASNRQHPTQLNPGFTLVELLAVIAIIGLLASLALPAISKIRARARVGATKAQLAQIETALESYYADWDTYPPMGNDWVGGAFFYSEDVGSDGIGPFSASGEINDGAGGRPTYPGPDTNGTEGNYRLDPGEDTGLFPWLANDGTAGNGRLDGTYYDRMRMFTDPDKEALMDLYVNDTYFHYYAGHVYGKSNLGMPLFKSYTGWSNYRANHPEYYNRWVIYSVGPDRKDHGLHNYYLTMQDGEDVGTDAYASDPADQDGDLILFEPSNDGANEENTASPGDAGDSFVSETIIETRWNTPGVGSEEQSPAGNPSALEGPSGDPVFSYDVREKRRGRIYAMPDGDPRALGVIMRYGP